MDGCRMLPPYREGDFAIGNLVSQCMLGRKNVTAEVIADAELRRGKQFVPAPPKSDVRLSLLRC
jgi:hypothetical protein